MVSKKVKKKKTNKSKNIGTHPRPDKPEPIPDTETLSNIEEP